LALDPITDLNDEIGEAFSVAMKSPIKKKTAKSPKVKAGLS
jgi:hypothetical protein